jgi:hypothetical protein
MPTKVGSRAILDHLPMVIKIRAQRLWNDGPIKIQCNVEPMNKTNLASIISLSHFSLLLHKVKSDIFPTQMTSS